MALSSPSHLTPEHRGACRVVGFAGSQTRIHRDPEHGDCVLIVRITCPAPRVQGDCGDAQWQTTPAFGPESGPVQGDVYKGRHHRRAARLDPALTASRLGHGHGKKCTSSTLG